MSKSQENSSVEIENTVDERNFDQISDNLEPYSASSNQLKELKCEEDNISLHK